LQADREGKTMKIMKIKFGTGGEKTDAFGIRFYGDIDHGAKQLGHVSEMFSDPDSPALIKNKRITLWYTFEKIRPYQKVSHFLDKLLEKLRKEGYEIVFSSIDDLVETSLFDYQGKSTNNCLDSERTHGYNASGGFSVTAEKNDGKLVFFLEEIETILRLAKGTSRTVFGISLMSSDHKKLHDPHAQRGSNEP
jgi:hypothetical protein